jgi:hypothetical protein
VRRLIPILLGTFLFQACSQKAESSAKPDRRAFTDAIAKQLKGTGAVEIHVAGLRAYFPDRHAELMDRLESEFQTVHERDVEKGVPDRIFQEALREVVGQAHLEVQRDRSSAAHAPASAIRAVSRASEAVWTVGVDNAALCRHLVRDQATSVAMPPSLRAKDAVVDVSIWRVWRLGRDAPVKRDYVSTRADMTAFWDALRRIRAPDKAVALMAARKITDDRDLCLVRLWGSRAFQALPPEQAARIWGDMFVNDNQGY